MRNCTEIATSTEVFVALRREHGDSLRCFASYSDPESNSPRMETWFGLRDTDFPIVHALTTWQHGEREYERVNEVHKYWLCVARRCECD
jgi:hypothetical protein